ncbi:hypothetical protein [Frankia sp. R82]|uniref:hypothetical protein n=1 Tax=Frankia sp. R82 TaxID=2950553 RepID=UPI0020448AE5|nr:hypothetical protein [Frankia sp. R82]MCM3887499.1 hypothetical protein [Frankia sp. R82]
MTGLPRVAVLGLDAATTAAAVALVDGGLEITVFASAPIPSADVATLTAYGCADRLVAVRATTLRLTAAAATAPPYVIDGTVIDGTVIDGTVIDGTPADQNPPADSAQPLGTFDAVVLNAHTEGLLPATSIAAESTRFGGVFDPQVAWVFHVGGPVELATAQGRWIGEYLRGRYALPDDPQSGAGALPVVRGRPWRKGIRSALAEVDRELQAGHARAATAGYPLPTPADWLLTTAAAPATSGG